MAREPSSLRTRVAARGRASVKHAAKEPKPNLKVPVRLASLERAAPRVEAIPLRILSNAGAPTSRDREKPDRIVTCELSRFQTRAAERNRALAKHAAKEPAKPSLKPPVRLASLEGTKTAIFRQVNKEKLAAHHDALEFPDGRIVLLTLLCEGQAASVLQLPAQPKTVAEAREQQRVGFVG